MEKEKGKGKGKGKEKEKEGDSKEALGAQVLSIWCSKPLSQYNTIVSA
jgi:hypothetical protein